MRKWFTLFAFTSFLFSGLAHAQCSKSSVNVDSIFNCWQQRMKTAMVDDSAGSPVTMSFDTIINIGDSLSGFGQFRIQMGDSFGGMNFSLKGSDMFDLDDDFFPGIFEGTSPFNINMDFDNMFRQLEEMFQDFNGIEVIPQPQDKPASKKPTYRI